jgi:hypothetical protein
MKVNILPIDDNTAYWVPRGIRGAFAIVNIPHRGLIQSDIYLKINKANNYILREFTIPHNYNFIFFSEPLWDVWGFTLNNDKVFLRNDYRYKTRYFAEYQELEKVMSKEFDTLNFVYNKNKPFKSKLIKAYWRIKQCLIIIFYP